jgi:hypothetical protein
MAQLETIKAKLVGVAPIMFHNERLANPTDKYKRELSKLTVQKKKTDDLFEQIKWLEWRAGFYEHDDRPVVTADIVLATVLNGARRLKKGGEVSAGVIESGPGYFFLEYEGPKTIEKLKGDMRFCDYRTVVVNRKRTMRARPIFKSWSLEIGLQFDPELLNASELWQALEIAGERIGMCERRPRYGRFGVDKI